MKHCQSTQEAVKTRKSYLYVGTVYNDGRGSTKVGVQLLENGEWIVFTCDDEAIYAMSNESQKSCSISYPSNSPAKSSSLVCKRASAVILRLLRRVRCPSDLYFPVGGSVDARTIQSSAQACTSVDLRTYLGNTPHPQWPS